MECKIFFSLQWSGWKSCGPLFNQNQYFSVQVRHKRRSESTFTRILGYPRVFQFIYIYIYIFFYLIFGVLQTKSVYGVAVYSRLNRKKRLFYHFVHQALRIHSCLLGFYKRSHCTHSSGHVHLTYIRVEMIRRNLFHFNGN